MAENTMLPGAPVMPDLIYTRRDDYIRVLREVDRSELANSEEPDFTPMVEFLRAILTEQLTSALKRLSGVSA